MRGNYPPGVTGSEDYFEDPSSKPAPHRCYGGRQVGKKNLWQECAACRGRIHATTCTSKKRPWIDCCVKRHLNKGIDPKSAWQPLPSPAEVTE